MKYFRSNLRFLRKNRNLTQAEIQAGLGIQRTTWNNYETGKSFPNLQLFVEIAKYFGISEETLLNYDISKGKVSVNNEINKEGKVSGKVLGKVSEKTEENFRKDFMEDFPNTYDLDFEALTHVSEFIEDRSRLIGLPMLYIPDLKDGLHFRFAVTTDNMQPTIYPRDYVIATYQEKILNALSGGKVIYYVDNEGKTDFKRVYYSKEVLSQFDEEDAKTFKLFNIPDTKHSFLLINDNKKYKSKIVGLNYFKMVFTIVEVQTRTLYGSASDMSAGMEAMLLEHYRQQSLNFNEEVQEKIK
jgi:transcriptional regulator with XRE-family HTH domain